MLLGGYYCWSIVLLNYLQEQPIQRIPGDSLITWDRLDKLIDFLNGSVQVVVDDIDAGAETDLWCFHLQPQQVAHSGH